MFLYKIPIQNNLNTCIVVRINNPTPKQILRYIEWKKFFPISYNFYLLSMNMMNKSFINRLNIKNIVVKFSEIKLLYPNITSLKGNCSNFKSSKLISCISHSESLILFF